MNDCDLGCLPYDATGGCKRPCPCDCHRAGLIARVESNMPVARDVPEVATAQTRDVGTLQELAPDDVGEVAKALKPEIIDAIPTVSPFGDGVLKLSLADLETEDLVNHPSHYTSHPSGVECVEVSRHLGSAVAQAYQYVFRCDDKGGDQDLHKAIWWLDDALKHRSQIFLSSWNFQVTQTLDRVVAAETDPNRILFFISIKRGNLDAARKAVSAHLKYR